MVLLRVRESKMKKKSSFF